MGLLKHARKTLKRVGYYKLPRLVFNSKVYMPSVSLFSNAEMGTIKDRNGMDLTEAEDIKK